MNPLLLLGLIAMSFDVTVEGWNGKKHQTRLQSGDAIMAWPGKMIIVKPTRGQTVRVRATSALRQIGELKVILPERIKVNERGVTAFGYPMGFYPENVPVAHRARAKIFSDSFYIVTDSSLRISPHFSLGMFLSKLRPLRIYRGVAHPLALDFAMVAMLEKIDAAFKADGYKGQVRIESPFRTPDYNNAAEAGRATFSQHMYGSACDIIFSIDDDKLHDDVNCDGKRDLSDLLPMARRIESMMKRGNITKGGIGVYHYIYRDGRPEEFTIHVDLRGKIVKWGSVYDSDIVHAAREINW